MSSRFISPWRNLFHSSRVDRELNEEVHATFELLVEEKMRAGMRSDDARRAAAIALGGIESVKEQVRDARAGAIIDSILQDLRYAARALSRTPFFTVTAAMSLAIGIAGNAFVFSLADAYLFRNRPGVADPDSLAEVGRIDSGGSKGHYSGDGFDTFSYPNYLDYRARQTVFESLAAYRPTMTFGLGMIGDAERVSGACVSANYFSVLGVRMALGRGFLPEEEHSATLAAVAVIGDRLWRRQFNGDTAVIGRTIRLNGRPFTIVGVAPPRFTGYTIDFENLWVPLTAYPDGDVQRVAQRGRQWLMGIGRLKDGVSITQARAEMARIGHDLEREHPVDNRRHGLGVEPPGVVPVVGRTIVRSFVTLLFVLVGLILLIACFNVASMLLVRSMTRAREIGVRLALGAARHRITRLLLIESVLVSLAGAAAGLLGGWYAIRLVERLIPQLRIDIVFDLAIDWRVTAFSVVIATITGVACGLAPARAASRVDLASTIVRSSGGGTRRLRVRSMFVVAQAALSVLLMVSAVLLGRSLRNAGDIDPGFLIDGVEVVGIDLRLGGYDGERGRAFADRLMTRIDSLPDVEAAASARVVPLTGEREGGRSWLPEEHGDARAIDASQNIVTRGYFRTLGLRLLDGRNFGPSDRAGAPAVMIVNETLARRAWPGQTPVGKRLVLGVSRRPVEVIGVVADAKYRTIGEAPAPFFYVPAAQRHESIMWLLMRSKGPSLIPQVRAVIREMDPNLPLLQAGALGELTAFTLFPQRAAAWVAGIVATIGILLAALGVYGVTAYNVDQRKREIGIRVALGAVRTRVLRSVVGDATLLAVAGTTLGLVAAALVTSLLKGMLYGVEPLDPVSFVTGGLTLIALAVIAALIPARRAASVNPVDALRAE